MARKSSYDEVDQLIRKRRKIRARESRRTTIRWIGIIIVVAAVTIGLLQLVPPLFMQMEIMDKSYSPRDLDRYKQIYKAFGDKMDKSKKDIIDQLK